MTGKKSSDKELKQTIQNHIDKTHYVKVFFSEECPEEFTSGFILNVSENFLMIQESHNFTLDGIKIIPYNRIEGTRHKKFEKTSEKIFSEEGLIKFNQKIISNTSLKNFESLFKSLKKQNFHCIVESSTKKKNIFSIGEILEINEKSVVIKNYDATGKIEKTPDRILFENINFITFNDLYSLTFRKYLKE
ncbi:hypothetical protein [Chryseobacterium indoltheticum]|jgi:hypothetical protein|uniref:hypothetical protein n=1 Tax=Chryseobacterium indoltheticum TaxID=254 RepID=UPI00242AF3C8|nr:hypothetical protein [Chryseobacterium indoltheticum]MDF2832409.1 hypothetical protein [Chryseobacterium indoltheticum]